MIHILRGRAIMDEIYLACPTTGHPVYAGVLADAADRKIARAVLAHAACPACGAHHDWQGAAVCLELPVTLPVIEAA